MAANGTDGAPSFEVPKECKAGVCYNEGANFELKVEMVPVPEPGTVVSTKLPIAQAD
jgi:hypothetical protein